MTTETQPQAEVNKSASVMARELFGTDFHGEVKEAPAQAPPQVEAETDDTDIVDTQETDLETDQAPPEDAGEQEENTISSFSELVESQGWDPEWATGLQLDVKINGETSKAKLADLINSYQTQQAAEQRLAEAKEKAKEITSELAAKQEKFNEQFEAVASILGEQREAIDAELKALEQGNLKNVDPAEYSSRRLQIQDKQKALEERIGKAAAAYQKSVQDNEAQLKQQMEQYKEHAKAVLLENIPEWKNPETAKAEQAELINYLVNNGVAEDEVKNLIDPNVVILARKAMLFDKGREKADVAKKKVVKVPKMAKAGAQRTAETANRDEIAKAQAAFDKNPSIENAMALKAAKRGAK